MTPREIIRRASADGVCLKATPAGMLKATGDQAAIDRWLPVFKAHKPDIIAALTELPADLERRIRLMAQRWSFPPEELQEALDRGGRGPAGCVLAVALDERREAEFRERGLLPRADA